MSTVAAQATVTRSRAADWLELTKPRVTFLILLTAVAGYSLGAGGGVSLALLPLTLGTFLVCSGTAVWNQVIERRADALMRRTAGRPLPAGRIGAAEAGIFGAALMTTGIGILWLVFNPVTGAVAALTVVSYLMLYTPLKQVTSLATIVGAVPGALPPVGGWAAATGEVGAGAMVLFGIVFLWQLPHFLAIAWLYRDDYRSGGMLMLPVTEESGRATAQQAVLYAAALLPVSLMMPVIGRGGPFYLVGALLLGALLLLQSFIFARRLDRREARRLLLASVIYLPLLCILLLLDGSPG